MPEPLILVPLDGKVDAHAVLPVARVLCGLLGASLHVVHVAARTPQPVAELAERFGLEAGAPGAWSIDSRAGEPATEILAAARALEARMIVMCTHTSTPDATLPLGATALEVLLDAPCPVVLVSPRLQPGCWQPARILMPHDGTPTANAAVAPAAELAHQPGAELVVVQVGGAGVESPAERGSLTMPLYVDQPQHEWPSWAGELLERIACGHPRGRLRASLHVRGGEPAEQILRMASDYPADLIVLAWKGEWTGSHAATLKTVIREARCPLLVVRAAA